ncbi:MAG TPA: ABC transporter permease subunit [Pseudolabrys sp.]|jgi:ABC-type nitrate/sulfonate/bicarbonate transport system permease component
MPNLAPFVVVAALLLGWQFALSDPTFVSDTLAPPSAVLFALWKIATNGEVFREIAETVISAVLGLALGAGLGVVVGIVSSMAKPIGVAIRGPVEILRPLPAIALVPLMTITFGLGLKMEVYVVAFAVFWPAIILTQQAVRQIEVQLIEVSAALELSAFDRTWKIILPSIVPYLIVMLRFTAAIALLIAVTVELVSNPRGLGREMMLAGEAFDPARMLAYLVVITAIGWCLNWALLSTESLFLRRRTRS